MNREKVCQCERDKHFLPLPGESTHAYQAVAAQTAVKTPLGTFNVCTVCAETCLAHYKGESQMAAIEFDKLYSDRKPPKSVLAKPHCAEHVVFHYNCTMCRIALETSPKSGRPSQKVKATEFRRVKAVHGIMIDKYENGICTAHIWQSKAGRWFEMPAGTEGSPREVKAPPAWVLK